MTTRRVHDSLRGKTMLVTGGTSGIGEATALALAAAGAHVALTGRRVKEGEAVAERVRAAGVKGVFIQGDATKEADIARFVSGAAGLTGALHGAFNNAGVELMGVNIADTTEAQYRQVFDVNVLGVLLSMKHEFPALLKSDGGAIVNNASIAGRIGMAGVSVYIASKHAVIGLTKCAAMEGAGQKIRVNSVSPAAIETPMMDRFTGNRDPEALKYMQGLHPIGRFGKPEEIASAVLFLLSDAASFITGHDLLVDGGFTVP